MDLLRRKVGRFEYFLSGCKLLKIIDKMEFENFSVLKKAAFTGNSVSSENIPTDKYKILVFLRMFQ